jgi:hypothetical protein
MKSLSERRDYPHSYEAKGHPQSVLLAKGPNSEQEELLPGIELENTIRPGEKRRAVLGPVGIMMREVGGQGCPGTLFDPQVASETSNPFSIGWIRSKATLS